MHDKWNSQINQQINCIITKHLYPIKLIIRNWSTIKETLNRTNNTKSISQIYHNDTIIQDPTELATQPTSCGAVTTFLTDYCANCVEPPFTINNNNNAFI